MPRVEGASSEEDALVFEPEDLSSAKLVIKVGDDTYETELKTGS